MIKKSVVKKYEKPVGFISNVITILTAALTQFNFIPSQIKGNIFFKIIITLILIIGGLILFRFLRDVLTHKPKIVKTTWYSIATLFYVLIITSIYIQAPPKSLLPPISHNTENISTYKNTILKIDPSDGSHIINGDNNVVGVNGDVTYISNKPAQRKMTRDDLNMILSSIASKDVRVRISYPANSNEALNFSNEIFDKLSSLGYANITKNEIGNSSNYFDEGRISVRKDQSPIQAINILINPQE